MVQAKHLSEPWFSLVATGKKIYEGRLGNNSMGNLPLGTQVTFFNADLPGPKREVTVRISGKKKFKTFKAMLSSSRNSLEKTLPTVRTVDAGVAVYRAFYTGEDEKKHGVIRLTMGLV